MKKVLIPHSGSAAEIFYEKLYEYMNSVLSEKSAQIVDVLGEEFLNSLLQRCGLDEVSIQSFHSLEL